MERNTLTRSRSVALTVEPLETRRLLATVSGIVFADANRNGRLDAGEFGLSGRAVFADYNYNARPDPGEPKATTNVGGSYSLTTRATQVSIRTLPTAGEHVSLPFGATNLWFSTVNQNTSGKNIGIVVKAVSTVNLSGRVFEDLNANASFNEGEPRFVATVFTDFNNNARLDPGELSATPDADGFYVITGMPAGRIFQLRAINPGSDTVQTTPSRFDQVPYNFGSYEVTSDTSAAFLNFGFTRLGATIHAEAFVDTNGNSARDIGEAAVTPAAVWLDLIRDGFQTPGEPLLFALGNGVYAIKVLPDINVVQGVWRVAARFGSDGPADLTRDVSVSANGQVIDVVLPFTSTGPAIAGTLFSDLNRNGRRDPGEPGLAGRTVFADYDYNGVVNGSDAIAFTDAQGNYTLATRSTNVSVGVVTRLGETVSLPYGATSLWFSRVSGTVGGRNIGIVV